jgi:hypothetical protein
MKLEQYTKVNGALRTPKFKEVSEDAVAYNENSKFESEAQDIYEINQELRDTVIVLSQFMRSFSAVYDIIDTSGLDPDVKAGIDAMIAEMNKFSTLGDSVFDEHGIAILTTMLERQQAIDVIYNDGTAPQIVDPYRGIKALGE